MSEQEQVKPSYMQQLDAWADEAVIMPLLDNGPDVVGDVRRAIHTKVLESYRNGQKAGPRPAFKPRKEFRR